MLTSCVPRLRFQFSVFDRFFGLEVVHSVRAQASKQSHNSSSDFGDYVLFVGCSIQGQANNTNFISPRSKHYTLVIYIIVKTQNIQRLFVVLIFNLRGYLSVLFRSVGAGRPASNLCVRNHGHPPVRESVHMFFFSFFLLLLYWAILVSSMISYLCF